MFDRIQYKTEAKATLKGKWKAPVLVALAYLGLTLVLMLPAVYSPGQSEGPLYYASTLLNLVIAGIMELAVACFFLEFTMRKGDTGFGTFVSGLNRWKDGILANLWMVLWTSLWSLLLLIPGIVKAYSYRMMFLILAENPGVSVRKSMNISKAMTKGFKGDLFVMDLSFLGWAVLCCLTAGIGFLWLVPYMYTAETNAYRDIKRQAISAGRLTEADFTGENAGEPA